MQSYENAVVWAGDVPESWEAQRIKTIAYAVATPAEGSLPYLGLESVRSFAGEMVNFRLESVAKVEAKGNLAECGDLLFSKLRVYLAKGLIADRAYRCSSEFVVLRLKKNVRADKDFVLYVLISEAFTSFIDAFSYGVKMPRISPTRLMQQLLPLPPKRQQHRIVEYLNVITAEIDGLVEKLQREVELLERYRRELIARTVTRGLDPDAPMKDSGIEWVGEIPDSWKTVSLSAITDENRRKNADLTEKNLLSLSYGEIIRKDIDLPFGLLPASFDGYQVVDSGYIILRMTDLQNDKRSLRTGLAHERGIITGAYIGLIPRGAVISGYLAWLLRFYDLAKVFYSLGGGVRQSANYKEVGKLSVLLPPIEEQQQIAEYLDQKNAEIDSTIAGIRKQIELLGRYRKQVINDAVTGKARVGEVA